jgi:hypothetical protein
MANQGCPIFTKKNNETDMHPDNSGPSSMTLIFNASVAKIYNATKYLARAFLD